MNKSHKSKGDKYRPVVHVMHAIDGIPVKVKISGKTFVLKAFKQRKGRWSKNRRSQ